VAKLFSFRYPSHSSGKNPHSNSHSRKGENNGKIIPETLSNLHTRFINIKPVKRNHLFHRGNFENIRNNKKKQVSEAETPLQNWKKSLNPIVEFV